MSVRVHNVVFLFHSTFLDWVGSIDLRVVVDLLPLNHGFVTFGSFISVEFEVTIYLISYLIDGPLHSCG